MTIQIPFNLWEFYALGILLVYTFSLLVCSIIDITVNDRTYHKWIPVVNTCMVIALPFVMLYDYFNNNSTKN
jgi:hypothetical protein